MKRQFLYPANMKAKPKLRLWSVRDVIVVGIAMIPSVLAAVGPGFYLPPAGTAVYAFLSIRLEDQSVLDYLKRAVRFFVTGQQFFIWKEGDRHGGEELQHPGADRNQRLFQKRHYNRKRQ